MPGQLSGVQQNTQPGTTAERDVAEIDCDVARGSGPGGDEGPLQLPDRRQVDYTRQGDGAVTFTSGHFRCEEHSCTSFRSLFTMQPSVERVKSVRDTGRPVRGLKVYVDYRVFDPCRAAADLWDFAIAG